MSSGILSPSVLPGGLLILPGPILGEGCGSGTGPGAGVGAGEGAG